jgi:hypothetical protein
MSTMDPTKRFSNRVKEYLRYRHSETYLSTQISARYLQYHYIVRNPNAVGSKDALDGSQ